jgi:hypothetical protein
MKAQKRNNDTVTRTMNIKCHRTTENTEYTIAYDHTISGHTDLCTILGVFKKRPAFLNSATTSIDSALRLLSAPSVRFWQQTAICPSSLWVLVIGLHPLSWARAQAVRRLVTKWKCDNRPAHHRGKCVPGSIPTMEETLGTVYRQQRGLIWWGQCLQYCKMSNKIL